jgi:hypothetical protein
MIGHARFGHIILLFSCFLLLAGCARFQVRTAVVAGPEAGAAVAALQRVYSGQSNCKCFDAEVMINLSISSWTGDRAASFSGYLQTMSPSHLKLIGINPFGQPQLIVVMDDKRLRSVLVPEAKVYAGDVRAKTFKKYFPPGFEPGDVFAWLAGRPPIGDATTKAIREGGDAGVYWFELDRADRVQLLFDSKAEVVLRYVLYGPYDNVLVDWSYTDYQDVGNCRIPGKIIIDSPSQNGSLGLELNDPLECEELSITQFSYDLPPGFESITVE